MDTKHYEQFYLIHSLWPTTHSGVSRYAIGSSLPATHVKQLQATSNSWAKVLHPVRLEEA